MLHCCLNTTAKTSAGSRRSERVKPRAPAPLFPSKKAPKQSPKEHHTFQRKPCFAGVGEPVAGRLTAAHRYDALHQRARQQRVAHRRRHQVPFTSRVGCASVLAASLQVKQAEVKVLSAFLVRLYLCGDCLDAAGATHRLPSTEHL